MTLAENTHLAAVPVHPEVRSWVLSMVIKWQGGVALTAAEEAAAAAYCTSTCDTGVNRVKFEAIPTEPAARVELTLETDPVDNVVGHTDQHDESDCHEFRREAALEKALITSIGCLVQARIPLELVEFQDAQLADVRQLRPAEGQEGPTLILDHPRFSVDERQVADVADEELMVQQELHALAA